MIGNEHFCNYCRKYTKTLRINACATCGLSKTNTNLDLTENFKLTGENGLSDFMQPMKYEEPKFKVGDIVTCDDFNMSGFITLNKVYEVIGLRPDEKRIVIIDDRGLEGWYNETRFR